MLRFLRHFRISAIRTQQANRYLLYALGEIILVVIGILIALQINNWNEEKKDRRYEVKMLREVDKSLHAEIKNVEIKIERMEALDSSTRFITNYIASGGRFHDSITGILFSQLNIGINHQYNFGPYEAIKSSGMDKISDDSLRNKLIHFYEFQFPFFSDQIKHYDRKSIDHIDQLVSYLQSPYIVPSASGARLVTDLDPHILEDPDFLFLLRSIQFRSRNLVRSLKELRSVIEEMVDVIEKEVGK